jgi:hypothetical protein
MQATMTLIETQTYGSWALPEDWHIVLTTNPDDGTYSVTSLDTAQQTRFITVALKFDIKCWAEFAENSGVDTRCISFLLMHPDLVTREINPRCITMFFNAIASIKDFESSLPLIRLIGEGSVGDSFSNLFVTFINNRLDRLISPEEILKGESEDGVLSRLRSGIGKLSESSYRADIASVYVTRISNYAKYLSQKGEVDKAVVGRVANLVTKEIFTNDMRYTLVKTIFNANQAQFKALLMDKDVAKLIMK